MTAFSHGPVNSFYQHGKGKGVILYNNIDLFCDLG